MVKVSRWIVELLDACEEDSHMAEGLRRFWDSKTPQSLLDVLRLEFQFPDDYWWG
jgi:hypothetical protein